MANEQWQMPKCSQGDVVLFSLDVRNFSDPCIGWVIKPPSSNTVQILTFTPNTGWIERPSVHHRSDPGLNEDNAWAGLGVWDFTDSAKAAMRPAKPSEVRSVARETVAAK